MYYGSYEMKRVATLLFACYEKNMPVKDVLDTFPEVKQFHTYYKDEIGTRKRTVEQTIQKAKKAEERKKIEAKARAEILKKLTPEERKAYGFDDKGNKKGKS